MKNWWKFSSKEDSKIREERTLIDSKAIRRDGNMALQDDVESYPFRKNIISCHFLLRSSSKVNSHFSNSIAVGHLISSHFSAVSSHLSTVKFRRHVKPLKVRKGFPHLSIVTLSAIFSPSNKSHKSQLFSLIPILQFSVVLMASSFYSPSLMHRMPPSLSNLRQGLASGKYFTRM